MYHDEIFEKALSEIKEESYKSLKDEITSLETMFEKLLNKLLNCSSITAERDFNVSTL